MHAHLPALWLIALGPLALAGLGLIPAKAADRARGAVLAAAQAATLANLAIALGTAAAVALRGTLGTGTLGAGGVGIGLYLDALSAALFVLVAFLGAVVVRYSRNYLDGDPGQGRFVARLCLALSCVLLLIVAGNLALFAACWIGTSLALHRLLVFYPDRPAAVLAARKKFVASRLGDACLVGAAALTLATFGSLDYGAIFAGAEALRGAPALPASVPVIAVLLALTALLKSAQLPLHGWLIEVMETPTPVSALLHAGIINAGGFLVLRFAGLVSLSASALLLLAVVGGLTALAASLVMLTQTSVKVSLAWSTIAQMGFMLLECGLGAFAAAALHILAHSLYKAHAFLSSGSVIDIARTAPSGAAGRRAHPARLIVAVVALLGATLAAGRAAGVSLAAQPGVAALAAVVALSVAQLIAGSLDGRLSLAALARAAGLAVLVPASFFAVQAAAAFVFAAALPAEAALRGPMGAAIAVLVIVSFAAVTLLQALLPALAQRPAWQAAYAHLSNGFYLNTLANRLAIRFWPAPPPAHPQGMHQAARQSLAAAGARA